MDVLGNQVNMKLWTITALPYPLLYIWSQLCFPGLPVTGSPTKFIVNFQPSDLPPRLISPVEGLSKRAFKAPPRAWLIGTPLSPTGSIGAVRWCRRRDLSRWARDCCTCEPVIDNLSAELDGLPFRSVFKAIHNKIKSYYKCKISHKSHIFWCPIVNCG